MPKTSIKVFLIEDSPADALLLKEALNNDPLTDFQVTVAEQLKQGLAKLAGSKFDVLLLDLGLPDSQGLETFEKAYAQFPDMPTIVLSGLTDETLALQAVHSGAQDYLVKGEAGWNLGPRAIRYAIERFQNQSAMRASEARFSTVFHSSPTSIDITRISDNKILEVNEAWEQITGYSSAEVVGRVVGELNLWVHPEEREQIVNLLRRDGTVHGFEVQMRRKFGQLTCILLSAELIEVAGEPCMLSMALDITERKQDEAKIHFQAVLLGSVGQAVIATDVAGTVIYFNRAAEELYGWNVTEALGRNIMDVNIPDISEAQAVEIMSCLSAGETWSGEIMVQRRDGTIFPATVSDSPVEDETGKLIGIIGVSADITERKRAEQALVENEYKLKEAERTANLGYYDIDTASGKTTWSEETYRIFGLKPGEYDPNVSNYNQYLHQDDTQKVFDLYDECIKEGKPFDLTYRIVRPNGEIRHVHSKSTFIADEQNNPTRLFGTIQDVTARKQAEEKLDSAREFLQSIQDALASHVSILDHEGNIVQVNSAWRNFGAQNGLKHPNHCIGMNYLDICESAKDVNAEEALMTANAIREVLAGEKKEAWIEYPCDSLEEQRWFVARITGFENNGQRWIVVSHENITPRKKAEEALSESEKRFRSIFETSGMGIFESTVDGHLININSAYARMFGFETPQHALRNITTIAESTYVHPQKRMQFINFVLEHPGMASFENEYRRRDGTTFIGELKIQAMQSAENQNTYIFGYVGDITQRKQTEENIRQRVKALELLYENSMAVNQSLDPKEISQKVIKLLGEKLDWHHTAIRLLNEQDNSLELAAFDLQGIQEEEEKENLEHLSKVVTHIGEGLIGWALQQSKTLRIGDVSSDPHYVESYPGIHSGLYAPLKSGVRTLGVISVESEKPDAFSEADERLITTLANQAANALENARLYQEISRYTEELELRVQERTTEIETTRQRLELAIKTAGIGIWESDVKQNKYYWDDGLFSLYGLSKENIVPCPQTWHNSIHPDDLLQQLKLMEETLHNNQPYNSEFRVIWPDASVHHIKSTGIMIRDAEGQPERMIGANQDITLHKQAEETLSLANAEMERGLRIKNEFLANMSHELRTPLNAILGISESLEEQRSGTLDEKQLRYVRTIIESGYHLLNMINDILDLSKIEASKLEIDIQSISVEKLCASSLRMVRELAQKKSLNISFKLDEKVKVISGDERRLKQSLVNLLGNAVKFTAPGRKIGLEVSGSAEANEVTFTVWDEGIGIDPEDIQRLFKPFVQLNTGLTREYSGTGLGLALVAQMARLHGGRVNLTSKLKLGSRFMLTLPWMPAEQAVQPAKPQVLAGSSKPDREHTGKILIVDDVKMAAELIGEYLRNRGFETFVAGDGLGAVSIAKQEHPQIILMDVMMPEMNGIEATKQIRADDSLRDVLIIGLTALAMPEDREQCLAAGMNDHLSKPIQMQELLQIIERYLPQVRLAV